MIRVRVLLATVMGGLLLCWVAGCGGSASDRDQDVGAEPGKDTPAVAPSGQSQVLTEAATRVETLAAAGHGGYYAGLEVAAPGLIVYRIPGDGLDGAVRAALPGVPVSFRDAPHSRNELTELAQRLLADRAYWAAQGVELWTVGARHDGTGVEVGTPAGDKLLAGAPVKYGPVPIIVMPMTSTPTAVALNP